MRPFSKTKADGTPRHQQAVGLKPRGNPHPNPPKAGYSKTGYKSRITNGKRPRGVDGRSAEARRHRDLTQAYGEGLDMSDERVRALVKDAAAAGVKIEMHGDDLDHLEFVRLSGVRRRNLEKLAAMKVRASPIALAEVEADAGLARLRAKLAQLAAKG
jgi:hypothetical protein